MTCHFVRSLWALGTDSKNNEPPLPGNGNGASFKNNLSCTSPLPAQKASRETWTREILYLQSSHILHQYFGRLDTVSVCETLPNITGVLPELPWNVKVVIHTTPITRKLMSEVKNRRF